MERSLQADHTPDSYSFTPRLLISALLIGALTGVAGWLINVFLQQYFIDPVFCTSGDSSAICSNGGMIAWGLAHVLAVGASVIAMVGAAIYRPLLVAIAALATTWGIHSWLGGMEWWSATLWQMAIFGLAYATYAWVARTIQFWLAVVVTLVVVIICRLVLSWA